MTPAIPATRDRPRWADGLCRFAGTPHAVALLAVVLAVAAVAESLVRLTNSENSAQFAIVLCLLAVATTLPLATLRPAGAGVAAGLAGVVSLAPFGTLTAAGVVAQLVALYRLGRHDHQLLAVCVSTPYVLLALARSETDGTGRLLPVALAALAPAAAWAGVSRRARAEAQAHDAQRQAVDGTLIEHTARGERARIARELHDVVAHHVSMIAVQAETARLTTPGMPAAGAQRLCAIGDTARTALTEMRRLLGVLREDAETGPAQRQPQPGLRQLNDLLDEVRDASGTGARLIVRGRAAALDPGVELAVYRIVQEALTNARRHAPGAAVDVELVYGHDSLRLRVRDNGPGPGGHITVAGHGLLGMRERAAAAGGRLTSGPATSGGFLIEAVMPATSTSADVPDPLAVSEVPS